MATPTPLGVRTLACLFLFSKKLPSGFARFQARLIFLSFSLLALAVPASAQFQQPFVFSSGGAVVVRNDQTGALTPVSGSPFPATNQTLTLDVQGRYLFGIGVNSIHMYAIIDSDTGAYQEVANSPFASANTDSPVFVAVEPTGNFLAVVNSQTSGTAFGNVETFQISPTANGGPALLPVAASMTPLDSAIIGISQPAASPTAFYLYLGPNFPDNPNFPTGEELDIVSIDPKTGLLSGLPSQSMDSSNARAYAADPQGRYVVTGRGRIVGQIIVTGVDGKFSGASLTLPENVFPSQLWVDSTGTFIYATYASELNPPVHIYSLDLQNAILSETASSPLPDNAPLPGYTPDPTGPYNYGTPSGSSVSAFTVDPATGYFVAAPNSPFSIPGAGSLTFSIAQGQQAVGGPSGRLSGTAFSFGNLQIGTPSAPRTVTLTSNGSQALSVNSITVSGADPSEFTESDTCQAPSVLQPMKFCTISVTFTPTGAGPQSASINITDTAPDTPQVVQYTGTGVAPPPAAPIATISPNPAAFATITQGTSSAPLSISVSNSGNAPLHISAITIGGNNTADFSNAPSNCSGATLAASASCNIAVAFSPLAAGQRTETITLADDAANSPQTITVQGNANPAFAVGTASTTATVTAGGTAQYQLQLTPGSNFTGSIALVCTGAPMGATCQIPATVQITSGTTVPFTVSVVTSGAAATITPHTTPPVPTLPWPSAQIFAGTIFCLLLAFLLLLTSRTAANSPRLALLHMPTNIRLATTLCIALLLVTGLFAGCGGGGSGSAPAAVVPPPPARIVTPPGTSIITVTPSAKNAAGQPLALQPIQLTLTVN
ncbi:MAG TPA: choice-of-anchor D domain-containing protein [Candidatus Dormibacteraeota bacterium]|nr:choice-of-anchor D domain-containing protein [Candidatus Dormibacteraeota bacterium]